MIDSEFTAKVIGAAIQVHRTLGPGLLESCYRECLHYELSSIGFRVERERPVPIIYRGVKLSCGYRIDLLVEGKLVIEVKAVERLNESHQAQMLTYLRQGGYKLGLLMNFHEVLLKDGIMRFIN